MRGYLRRRAALARFVRCRGINDHPSCVCIQSAFSALPALVILFTARHPPRGSSLRMRGFPSGIDSGVKGIKSLSISGIPERRRPRYIYGAQFTPLLTVRRFTNLAAVGFSFYCALYRGEVWWNIVASFVPLLTKWDSRRECTRGIISQLDDTNDAKLAQRWWIQPRTQTLSLLEHLYYKIKNDV